MLQNPQAFPSMSTLSKQVILQRNQLPLGSQPDKEREDIKLLLRLQKKELHAKRLDCKESIQQTSEKPNRFGSSSSYGPTNQENNFQNGNSESEH